MTAVTTTSAATTATGASAAGTSGTSGTINNQSDYNAAYTNFLQMLTTELQNQDPTSPMDTSTFTSQLVGFSQLEQQLHANTDLDSLVSGQSSTGLGSALGYLGHTVTVTGSTVTADGTSPISLGYTLPSAAQSATLTVTDSNGNVVSSLAVPTASGSHSVAYDGATGDQATLPAGTYQFAVTALDASGKAIATTDSVTAKVTGVDTSSGSPEIIIAGQQYAATAVTQIMN